MAGTPSPTTSTPTESATDFTSMDASSTAMPTASVWQKLIRSQLKMATIKVLFFYTLI